MRNSGTRTHFDPERNLPFAIPNWRWPQLSIFCEPGLYKYSVFQHNYTTSHDVAKPKTKREWQNRKERQNRRTSQPQKARRACPKVEVCGPPPRDLCAAYCEPRRRDRHAHAAYPRAKPAIKIDDWMRKASIGFVRWSAGRQVSLPGCDDKMFLTPKTLPLAEPLLRGCRSNAQRKRVTIMSDSRFRKNNKPNREWFDSNVRIAFRQALWRMLESKDHQQIQVAGGTWDLTFA
jgi:hypothetical protein